MTREECIAKSIRADEQSRDCPNPTIRANLQLLAAEWRTVSLTFPDRDTDDHFLEAAE